MLLKKIKTLIYIKFLALISIFFFLIVNVLLFK